MARLPPSTPDKAERVDIDALRDLGMERWEKLRTAVGEARSLRILEPNHPIPRLGRFPGIGFRGKGGFGVVFEVLDPILERHLALKCCILSDDETCERLMKEAKIMASFTHPNIVRVYETGWHGNDLFFVMEYVTGRTALDFILRKSRPSWVEIIRVYQGAGAGLAAVHAAGIVHRDFKPSNILLDDDDWPRLTDFGLSYYDKGGDELDDDDAELELCGTLSFLAPEVLLGMLPTALSDQWSFCVALWMTFDRALPFAGDTPEELHEAMCAGPVVHDASVPEELRAVARRGLELNPRARFADMKALLAELRRVLLLLEARAAGVESPGPVVLSPSPPSQPPPPVRTVSRKWQQVAFVAASALAASFTVALVMPAESGEQEIEPADITPRVPSCVSGGVPTANVSPELEAVCQHIRQGDFDLAYNLWEAARNTREPQLGDSDDVRRQTYTALGRETRIVGETFADEAESLKQRGGKSELIKVTLSRSEHWIVLADLDQQALDELAPSD